MPQNIPLNDIILPPNPAGLIEGLRDTGYTFNNALADIVDNSIDAQATDIAIRIEMDNDGEVVISVADNGCGMTLDGLKSAMTYGTRSEGRISKRLGKFGLGLKTASTAFCRKLSVITRAQDGQAFKLTWDLDNVVARNNWSAQQSEPTEEEIGLINELAGSNSGTLVLWEKVDRAIKPYEDPTGAPARKAIKSLAEDFTEHAAAVYQRFLEKGLSSQPKIKMKINGNLVTPWDPFCSKIVGTEIVADMDVPVILNELGEKAQFKLRAVVLPRGEDIPNIDERRMAKIGAENQGFYVYREGRLIYSGGWMGMFSNEPHGSLLRAELSFNHELDGAFNVDIKKSKINLDVELHDFIKKQLAAPRRAADERYRKGVKKDVGKKSEVAHVASNTMIASHQDEARTRDSAVITSIDKERGKADIKTKFGSFTIDLPSFSPKSAEELHIQVVESIDDGLLWRPILIGDKHAIQINRGHPFYLKVYLPSIGENQSTVKGIDSLLWSLGEAELSATHEPSRQHFEMLRFEVSRLLRILVKDLPDQEIQLG
jgi:hypothetical protein